MASARAIRVGNYSIHERIGAGGFGVVRKAINETDGTIAAVKILDKKELQLHEMTQNLKKEISLLTLLKHPNIVEGYSVLTSKTKVFLFMEYIDGGDMHTVLSERRTFSEMEARNFFLSLMSSLAYCHKRGVFHRDLKLENLLITKSGHLKVCDFGLASVQRINSPRNELCKTIVGTEDFSPPEILKGTPYRGDKADIWSAGVILYVMLAGFCPFRGSTSHELMQKIISCKFSFPHDFPQEAKRLVAALLVPDSKKRPSAKDILTDPWFEDRSPRNIQDATALAEISEKQPRSKSKKERVTTVLPNLRKHPAEQTEGRKPRSTMYVTSLRRKSSFRKGLSMRRSAGDKSLGSSWGKNLVEPHILFKAMGKANVSNFVRLYSDMLDPVNGIRVQDRKWRLRTFPKCFIGSEAVTWLAERLKGTREMAVEVGQKLLIAGAFHHVCREHEFEDGYFFYRWHHYDPNNAFVLNTMLSDSRLLNIRPADMVVHELFMQIMLICKAHQQLNDLMEVNVVGIQQDSLYKRYLKASRELQSCTLPIGQPKEVIVPFFINLHNLLWIQSRIHIGAYDDMSYEELENAADQFEYLIGGRYFSLLDVTNSLYKACKFSICFLDEDGTDGGTKSQTPSGMLTRFFLKPRERTDLSDLALEELDPIMFFALTDGGPESPPVYAYTRGSAEVSFVKTVAARAYLERVVEVDVHECTITYPRRVEVYRQLTNMVNDLEVLVMIRGICGKSELGTAVHKIMRKSEETGIQPVASLKEKTNMMQSDITFAPTFKKSL